ncbi:tetracycline resistance ribosomal protection protein Otr(A) [Streptomyces sp. LRE541]|uniref:tetracycline resistance ribosomal protection protein Otr(A) n=1 Tax=Streptomyces sp. LRE541 TaxID=2931983 RepID=UPI00200C6DF4|nr:tetracycline resistance ribosomal protection protein Otr(A) [Streptomyces sp. LRE541]UPZ27373.1 tetracycline resistance ribosomal protection protein Otr(A) [Streptomyces sp. LRE541]
MNSWQPARPSRTLNIGILAHVDAGKTSLTERLLFDAGVIDRLGSVDSGDTRTDDGAIERQRGITIRSAVAAFTTADVQINLIDTPGHSDFIAEVERALEVLDGAVLLLSAVEGVQARTRVLMKALRRLRLPTLVFVNKIDRAGAREEGLLQDIRRRLTPHIVPLTGVRDIGTARARVVTRAVDDPRTAETLAETDPGILAAVVDGPPPTADALRAALAARTADGSLHPVLFGSALGGQGIAELVAALPRLIPAPGPVKAPATAEPPCAVESSDTVEPRGTVFAVRTRPDSGRTAYLRLYEGRVTPRQRLTFLRREADGREREVTGRALGLDVVGRPGPLTAGNIAAVTGLHGIRVGDRLGPGPDRAPQFAAPTLETLVRAREAEHAARLRSALLALADQDPLLHARPGPSGSTALLLYGEVQKEVLAATLAQDFGIEAEFEPSRIRCLERPVGTGEAYEEIQRHGHTGFWATVGLRVEPGPPGSGSVFAYETELGALPRAFHQAIEDTVHATLLDGGPHGRPVTDCRVTLVRSGYAAPLSTAGDFRGLTPVVLHRALEHARTRVYEPYHSFEADLPLDALAPVTARLAACGAEFGETTGGSTSWLVTGRLPARHVRDIELRLPGLTHGEGVWWSRPSGYRPLR